MFDFIRNIFGGGDKPSREDEELMHHVRDQLLEIVGDTTPQPGAVLRTSGAVVQVSLDDTDGTWVYCVFDADHIRHIGTIRRGYIDYTTSGV